MDRMAGMPAAPTWIAALRSSHERFRSAAQSLDGEQVTGPSYATEWTVAQVASHLGSSAEIFSLYLDAGLSGAVAPSSDAFPMIWDQWNNRGPAGQVADSIAANEALVGRLEQLTEPQRQAFALTMFGMDVDMVGFSAMRLGEHAVHTWDVIVATEPDATVSDDAVGLLVDRLILTASHAGKPVEAGRYVIETLDPVRRFTLEVGSDVTLVADATGTPDLQLPAEAFLRLVYGRLDPEHMPAGVDDGEVLAKLRRIFRGF
jgi:uncharacterized protein (TIGR03083 family)